MSGQVAKAAPGEVIKAAKMFTKNGRSKQVSLVTELSLGLGLGIGAGLVWKVSFAQNTCLEQIWHISSTLLKVLGFGACRFTTGTRRERLENTIQRWL